jgi:hypothetical protein
VVNMRNTRRMWPTGWATHPGALRQVRLRVAGDFIADDGHDTQPHASHLLILNDKARSHWAGCLLALPGGATDKDAHAAGVAVIVDLRASVTSHNG